MGTFDENFVPDDGEGAIAGSDGTRIEDTFKNGKLTGYGVATFPNGDRYEGRFKAYAPEDKNEYPNGQGVLVKPDGTRYVGKFKDEGRAGRGVVTYPDGTHYIGEWLDGEPVDAGA